MLDDEQFLLKSKPSSYVGLIPAAGLGTRLPDRNTCKELVPVGLEPGRQEPVIAALLRSLKLAGIHRMNVVVRREKTDLKAYLADTEWRDLQLGIIETGGTSGVPETVVRGLDETQDRNIAFGFPDILFTPESAFSELSAALGQRKTDVVLGLFPTDNPAKMDMVEYDSHNMVKNIEIKPAATRLKYTWVLAVWNATFSHYLIELLRSDGPKPTAEQSYDHLGQAFQSAIKDRIRVGSVLFDEGRVLDIGTPDDLALAANWYAG